MKKKKLKKTTNGMSNYPQVSDNERVLWITGGLLFRQTKGWASLIRAQDVSSQMQGVFCNDFRAMLFFFFVCLCVRDRKRKKPSDYRHSSILTFISVNSARRGGQRREIVVKLINLQCANQPSWWYRLLCEWQNALVNDSRELCGPTRQRFLLSRVW